jgi:hypothetical protein
MVPASFKTERALEVLNVAAVGLALAAVVAGVTGVLAQEAIVMTGIPTWILGTVWAWVLRVPKTVGKSTFRWGWVASMPLAILNASLAGGLLYGTQRVGYTVWDFLGGAILGATFGAFVWLPALFLTLLCFGLPIAWAQQLAKKGLAGEERGEWIVGLACVAMSVVGLLLSIPMAPMPGVEGVWLTRGLGALGALAGAASTGLALARETRRRRFVTRVEAGDVAGYRVDPTEEGKVLVRIVAQGQGYRVADFEEEVFDLDVMGEATRPKRLEGAVVPR